MNMDVDMRIFFLNQAAMVLGNTLTASTASSSPNVKQGSTGRPYFTANRMKPVRVRRRTCAGPVPAFTEFASSCDVHL
jgi:hypothetical protein